MSCGVLALAAACSGSGGRAPSSSSPASSSSGARSSAGSSPTGASHPSGSSSRLAGALTRIDTAETVRVRSNGLDNGKPLRFDLHYGSNGSSGTITEDGSDVSLISTGGYVYVKTAQTGSMWVKYADSSSQAKSFAALTDRERLLGGFSRSLGGAGSAVTDGSSRVDGTSTTVYVDADDVDKAADKRSSFEVTSSGTPYLLRLVDYEPNNGGTLLLTQWNEPFTVSAPPAAQTTTG